jgi:pantetheine-phosphate adenylyltransferase
MGYTVREHAIFCLTYDIGESAMNDPTLSPRIAVYPGSFDPITLGHLNVMERASKLFDRLIIGVGVNIEKQTLFTPEERHAMIHEATADLENVEIRTFTGLAVSFVKQCGARVMVRGVRPITDIAAELTMMMANRRLAPDVETLFMIADGELAHVSSSLIKQIASVADDAELARFLPPNVVRAVRLRMERDLRK